MVGVEQPIVQAPMGGGPATPELVAAVSNAGALGFLAAGYLDADQLREQISATRRLTGRPFGVNLFIPPSEPPRPTCGPQTAAALRALAGEAGLDDLDLDPTGGGDLAERLAQRFAEQVDVLLAASVPVVSFAFGRLPAASLARLQRAGVVVAGTAVCTAEARQLEADGCDAVVAQGYEAGAHRGGFRGGREDGVGLLALLEHCRGALSVPYVAAGGIVSGAGLAAVLALGAAAAQIGTAFLVADESGAGAAWKAAVAGAADTDTVMTRAFTGKAARGVRNHFVDRMAGHEDDVAGYPVQHTITEPIRTRARQAGDGRFQSLWAGQAAGRTQALPAAEIVARFVDELAQTVGSLNSGRAPQPS
jgi:nitronate monooxygenase